MLCLPPLTLPPPVSLAPPSSDSSHQSCRPPPGYCTWWTLLRPHLGLSVGSDTAGSSLPETHFFPLGSKRPPTTRSWCDPVSGLRFSLLCHPLFFPASKWSGLAEPALFLGSALCGPGPHPGPGFSATQPAGSHVSISGWHLSCLPDCVCTSSTHGYPGVSSVVTCTGNKEKLISLPPVFPTSGRGTIYLPSCSNPKSRHQLWFFPLLCTDRTHCGCWLIPPVAYQECVCFLALALPSS